MMSEVKIIGLIVVATVVILGGAMFFFSKEDSSQAGETSKSSESKVLSRSGIHWHPKVTVTIKGQKQEFTGDIGLGAIHEPIHTHNEDYKDGVVHLEIEGTVTEDETRLGRFFKIWGKQFNSNCVFDKCNGPDGAVKMYVNGAENKEFENYPMRYEDNIEIKYE